MIYQYVTLYIYIYIYIYMHIYIHTIYIYIYVLCGIHMYGIVNSAEPEQLLEWIDGCSFKQCLALVSVASSHLEYVTALIAKRTVTRYWSRISSVPRSSFKESLSPNLTCTMAWRTCIFCVTYLLTYLHGTGLNFEGPASWYSWQKLDATQQLHRVMTKVHGCKCGVYMAKVRCNGIGEM